VHVLSKPIGTRPIAWSGERPAQCAAHSPYRMPVRSLLVLCLILPSFSGLEVALPYRNIWLESPRVPLGGTHHDLRAISVRSPPPIARRIGRRVVEGAVFVAA
jgi:hypothetical protein